MFAMVMVDCVAFTTVTHGMVMVAVFVTLSTGDTVMVQRYRPVPAFVVDVKYAGGTGMLPLLWRYGSGAGPKGNW